MMQSKKKRQDEVQKKAKKSDEPMQTFQITIPVGVKGNESIEFQLPDGRTVCFLWILTA